MGLFPYSFIPFFENKTLYDGNLCIGLCRGNQKEVKIT